MCSFDSFVTAFILRLQIPKDAKPVFVPHGWNADDERHLVTENVILPSATKQDLLFLLRRFSDNHEAAFKRMIACLCQPCDIKRTCSLNDERNWYTFKPCETCCQAEQTKAMFEIQRTHVLVWYHEQ